MSETIELSEAERSHMLHALGEPLDKPPEDGFVRRNYFIEYEPDAVWERLVERGLATKRERGDIITYCCTDQGIEVATGGRFTRESQ